MRIFVAGLALYLMSAPLNAATTGISKPSGQVENILEIKVTPFQNLSSVLPELRTYNTPASGVVIATIEVSNNNSNGFALSFHSQKTGKLIRLVNGSYPASPKNGDQISYTIDLERGTEGKLGGSMPPSSERRNLNLAVDKTVQFDSNITESTIKATFNVMIHTRAKPELFFGTYSDAITFTAADL